MNEKEQIKNYMRDTIQDICDKIGPRPPCSKQEAQCANYIKFELEKYSDNVNIEKFYCHPGSYRATFRVPSISILISTISYWLYLYWPLFIFLLISLSIVLFSTIIIETNLMRNIELIDPLFQKSESANVIGKFKPRESTKNIIIIGGHHDSNWEFTLLKKWPKYFTLFSSLPIILNFLVLGIYILKVALYFLSIPYIVLYEVDLGFAIVLTLFIPISLFISINTVSNIPVMGASDNLTSTAVILALANNLKSPNNLKNTEIWLVSHGCEEIGTRGSKRFSKKHFNKLKDAYVINVDNIGGKGSELKIITSEVRYVVKHNIELANEISKIAHNLDVPYHMGSTMAFTDSMAYSRNKIKACSIIGRPINKSFAPNYHSTKDTIDKLDFNNLWNCYLIVNEFIKRVDQGQVLI